MSVFFVRGEKSFFLHLYGAHQSSQLSGGGDVDARLCRSSRCSRVPRCRACHRRPSASLVSHQRPGTPPAPASVTVTTFRDLLRPLNEIPSSQFSTQTMGAFNDNVTFSHIAREWRCKWESKDGDLAELQKVLDGKLAAIKAVDGVVSSSASSAVIARTTRLSPSSTPTSSARGRRPSSPPRPSSSPRSRSSA